MKKTLILAASLMVTAGAFAQGTVAFNNFISGALRSPVYGPEASDPTIALHGNAATPSIPAGSQVYTGPLLAGTGFTVTLWGIGSASFVNEGSLQLLGTTTFRTGTGAGLVNTLALPGGNVTLVVPNAPADNTAATAGSKATLQLRAWQTLPGANTWADALAAGAVNPFGSSDIFSPPADVGGAGSPPAATPNLVGLTSFNIHVVPEPSLIALGALGLGALLLRRRKA